MDSEFLNALFLGPNAENQQVFERLLLEFFRDHAYWRRNFHPEDGNTIPTSAPFHDGYLEMIAKIRRALGELSADLKRAAPFFSPRYIGHMNSDLLMPGLIALMMTTLYNPNNVSEESGPATVSRELAVGRQLATMFGYQTDLRKDPCAWGHLTSGGTVANYEALFNLREVKFFPLALREAARAMALTLPDIGPRNKPLDAYTSWELVNFSVSQTVDLMQMTSRCFNEIGLEKRKVEAFWDRVNKESLKHLGTAEFFEKHRDVSPPVVIVASTAHYSWDKAMRVLGLGERQLIKVATARDMTMNMRELEQALEGCFEQHRPVLAVVGVLGTTEFSSVDPIGDMVAMREHWLEAQCFFGIHVDAAWGGYLASLFRRPDGSFCELGEVRSSFKYFPTQRVYKAIEALASVDSITVDPHKLGYLPYPSGAYICRDIGVVDFIVQKVSYLYDLHWDRTEKSREASLRNFGQFILEGSKPGAAAAAAYICHKVLPLHKHGFGLVVQRTVRACEYFHFKLKWLAKRLSDRILLTIPVEPQTNIICFAINPRKNRCLGLMNHFERQIFNHIKIDGEVPLQMKSFIGSYTSLVKNKVQPGFAKRILKDLGIDGATFTEHPETAKQSDHIFLFRHSLMSPWLLHRFEGANYIDRFCECLEGLIIDYWKAGPPPAV